MWVLDMHKCRPNLVPRHARPHVRNRLSARRCRCFCCHHGTDVSVPVAMGIGLSCLLRSTKLVYKSRWLTDCGPAPLCCLCTQVGGVGWVAGLNGIGVRQAVGQDAAHELQQNLGVQKVQLQPRCLVPPRCLPRFRQRKEGELPACCWGITH